MELCLDTNIIIHILRGNTQWVKWLQERPLDIFYITQITLFELYLGLEAQSLRHKKMLEQILECVSILELTNTIYIEAAKECARLERLGNSIEFRDALIGVCAREYNIPLVTQDRKHFVRIQGLTNIQE